MTGCLNENLGREYSDGEDRVHFNSMFDNPTFRRFKAMGNDHTNQQTKQDRLIHYPLPPPEVRSSWPSELRTASSSENTAFYYRRKTGTKATDESFADAMRDPIEFANTKRNTFSVFKGRAANLKVNTLRFTVCDSPIRDFLYKTLYHLATDFVKKEIVKAMKDAEDW
ncbi:hypothetical protein D9619_013463 [Psilocybe cf. subviscida]|uniref:Uncharacterized protein n=1 Tax=Psilocybe cf. subviscida TaxID=2480587 RepID=A0A8H5BRX0_9AGAR|nr:hypothetical protein D9619_013463 [Psilocybe cf. subviscida]